MRRPWLRGAAGVLVCAALLTAGCSGSGADQDDPAAAEGTTPTEPTDTTAVMTTTTTQPPTTTMVPPPTTSTVAPTTTSTSTSTSTTLAEPSVEELEAEIAAAYEDVYWGYWACLRSPLDCDVSWLEPDSGSYSAMFATMEALAERDRFVGDDDVGYYVIESIELSDDRTEATVVTCWWSTAVLYTTPADPGRPAGPDNPPTIVNNTPSSGRQIDELVLVDGRWLQSGGRLIGDDYEEDQCGG